jgi:hypothetical protein
VYPVSGIGVNSTKLLEEMRTRQAAGPPEPDPGKITGRYPEENLPGPAAWIDGDYKLHRRAPKEVRAEYKLFDLNKDPQEKTDLAAGEPQRVERMKGELADWQRSVIRSLNGEDYSRPGTRNGDPG